MPHASNHKPTMTRVRRSKDEARAAYDRMSRWYDLMAGASEQPHARAGLRKLDARDGERILEIGFGTGHALASLTRAVGRSGQVCGVDISEGMAQQARARLEKAGLWDAAVLALGDGAQLPLQDRSLDGIFMSFTLELFDTPRIPRVLSECKRVLREAGRLCVVSLAKRGRGSLSVRLYEWVHAVMPRYVDCRPIPAPELLEEAGFEVAAVERRSMWTLPVDVVLAREATPP
jgi:demethylmenaquinone methyltransferase/2-methoxy-6-polyprenyl-1,4-benzoquinol methylase